MKTLSQLILSSLLGLIPTLANACTVCFTGDDKDVSRGFFWGIIVLLALLFGTFSVIFLKIVLAARRNTAS